MAVSSEIEAILVFLQKNGFTEAETAFKQDISEKKKDLKLFDYEKFEFPMSPPLPPPVKIGLFYPSSSSNSDSSSDFMSIGSFNTDASTVGFTNPYGIRTGSRIKSEASSADDFGTARDYRDIDILNNGYWYDEKDEDYLKHSSFGKAEFLASPPEDKFVTTSEVEGRYEQTMSGFHSETSIVCLDKSCPLYNMPMNYDHDLKLQSFYSLGQTMRLSKQGDEVELECFDESDNRSIRLCDCCTRLKESQGVKSEDCGKLDALSVTQLRKVGSGYSDYDFKNEKEGSFRHRKDILDTEDLRHEAELQLAVVENSSTSYRGDEYEREDIGETVDELHDPVTVGEGEECGTPNELQMYESREEEYEVFNLRIVHRKNKTGFEAHKDLPIVLNTTLAGRYYVTEYLGSAAFSKVVQAHDLHTGVDVCLKIIKNDKDFFDQSLDEIKLLKFVNKHDPGDTRHILRLYDYFYHQEHLFIVCELLRANLYEFLKYNQESGGEPYFTLPRLQVITRQILEALEYLHNLGIIHCDLKPENILIKSYSRSEVKVIDLGSSCFQTDNLCLYIQSRSYRAPEVILGLPYDQRIDIWSLGCILAELCSGEVLFPNDAVVTLLERMIAMFGPIDMEMLVKGQETHKYFTKDYEYLYHINEETSELQYVIPEESSLENFVKSSDDEFTEFLKYLLEMNPMRRPTASEALQHPWLSQVYDS